jgi:predicted phosphohydrolase
MYNVKFQIASDLHLEFADNMNDKNYFFSQIIKPKGDILILSGDIGNPISDIYQNFLGWCSNLFETVLVLAGNHEYYNTNLTVEETDIKIKEICKNYGNVIFLQKHVYCYRNFMFIGCTLWSMIHPQAEVAVVKYINDFKYIKNFSLVKHKSLYTDQVQWLENTIQFAINNDKIPIVITHHPMIKDPLNKNPVITDCAFENDLVHLLEKVPYHIAGHTHRNRNLKIGNCSIMINCKGYNMAPSYKNDLCVELFCCK